MLPNVSGLSLQRRCVPCGTPVSFRTREEQLRDYLKEFVHLETLEDQVDAAECDICTTRLGDDPADATREGRSLPDDYRKWMDFCGHGHFFHRWCIQKHLDTRGADASCPDCRRPMSDELRTFSQTMEIYPPALAPAASAEAEGPPPWLPFADRTWFHDNRSLLVQRQREEHEEEQQGSAGTTREAVGTVVGLVGAAAGAFSILMALSNLRAEWYARHG